MPKTGDDACKIDNDAVYLCEDGRLDSVFYEPRTGDVVWKDADGPWSRLPAAEAASRYPHVERALGRMFN